MRVFQVQVQLYSRVATEFSIEGIGRTGIHLRELVDADRLLFIIREYYDVSAGPTPYPTPDDEDSQQEKEERETRAHVRPYLLLILKAYFTKVK